MSNLTLRGNPAGTGTFTVESPNSNNNRTITLPDQTATLATTTDSITQAQLATALNVSGSAPMFACRAWVSFTGATTVTVRGSGNVASVVRNSAGNYTINFSVAMQDANYSVVISADAGAGAGDKGPYIMTQNASFVQIINYNASGVLTDTALCSVAVFR